MKAVSYLFHPLLMPTMVFGIIFYTLPESIQPISAESIPYLILAILITTFIIPLMSVTALRFTATISSFSLEKREERVLPFLFITIFYGLTTYLFIEKIDVNSLLSIMMISTTVLILLLTIITIRFKISIHGAGISGGAGFLMGLTYKYQTDALLYPLLLMILVAGLVMSARLYLNAHKPNEVMAGALFGFSFCFSAVFFLA